jgi:basic membrane protein A
MGIANGGVGYALDEHNASLVSGAMKSAVDAAASSIASGSMSVHNYTDDETCPAISF